MTQYLLHKETGHWPPCPCKPCVEEVTHRIAEDWGIPLECIRPGADERYLHINGIVGFDMAFGTFDGPGGQWTMDTEQAMFVVRYKEKLLARVPKIDRCIYYVVILLIAAIGTLVYGMDAMLTTLLIGLIFAAKNGLFDSTPVRDLAASDGSWIFAQWRARPNGWWQRRLMTHLIS